LPDYPAKPWWHNSRGELFVFAQFGLFILLAWGPRTLFFLPDLIPPLHGITRIAGLLLMIAGTLLALAATVKLGRNLTPFITPKANSVLLEQGAYRIIRHPIYSGLLQIACGWSLWVQGWLTLVYTVMLFMVFDAKSRREEQILRQTFPGYDAYSSKVRRLIPFIY